MTKSREIFSLRERKRVNLRLTVELGVGKLLIAMHLLVLSGDQLVLEFSKV
jgi:hypothetical protein